MLYEKKEELKAIEISADALINFANRYSHKAKFLLKRKKIKNGNRIIRNCKNLQKSTKTRS